MIANSLKSPNDIWRLKIKKWADMEAAYMTLCCHILCKNGVLFCIIQHLLFGFCSSQCSIYVVKFSKTHTMVVHFLGRSGEKENWEHHHPGALKLVARGYQRKLDFSPCLSFLMLHVVFDQHINCPHHQLLHRTNTYTLTGQLAGFPVVVVGRGGMGGGGILVGL